MKRLQRRMQKQMRNVKFNDTKRDENKVRKKKKW